MTVQFVYMTAANRAEAERIGRHLVEARLAACVNLIDGMTSIFRWEDEVQTDQEVVLIAKSVADRIPALVAAVKDMHSYETPCVVALPAVGGYAPFLAWVEQAVVTNRAGLA